MSLQGLSNSHRIAVSIFMTRSTLEKMPFKELWRSGGSDNIQDIPVTVCFGFFWINNCFEQVEESIMLHCGCHV